ncbi:polysaccharide deacetylase family protein [Aeromicrobium sp. CFBP 8757]|uniref:polysaccharide deacetylase family protein n=1 Tax=Aeromicrobium sp. CFBP 8757 TaxID=2775288 RepID=UPI00177D5E11|nr:polysaccharide deacetylase family protein [Aeromicrobium sp. CFBP 8757]MBD8606377.1 polysaccharide deacetylase family protein [Aeromicrobium sp. CFBP 8757]
MSTWPPPLTSVLVALATVLVPVAAGAAPEPRPDREQTVVTLMFDDGWRGQSAAGDLLAAHGMRATFFVNSGMWTYPDYLTRRQVVRLVHQGHEIGGHTLTHARLATAGREVRRREACQDRADLLALGTTVTSFAYPYGYRDDDLQGVVAGCGYTSARAGDGLADRPPQDPLCDCVARLPFDRDRWAVPVKPTGEAPLDAPTLERWVRQAESVGGWVPIVLGRVCDGCGPGSISEEALTSFVAWLARRPASTRVETFAAVVGAASGSSTRDDVSHDLPPARVQPAREPLAAVASPSVPARTDYAVSVSGLGIGQAQIVGAFVVASMIASIGFRVVSRRRRTHLVRHTA